MFYEVENMIAEVIGYDSIRKHLAKCGYHTVEIREKYHLYTKELWIDRREKSKSLAWSSVLLALGNIKEKVVERPKALGDIRGVTYIYGMFYRFGMIDVPDEIKEKMCHPKNRKKNRLLCAKLYGKMCRN